MKDISYINDSIHGLILISNLEKEIISSFVFNRLHDIYQNSTVYLTFPSNRTKRFEHSLGTMKLCSDMFYYSILNSDINIISDFFKLFNLDIDSIDIYIYNDFFKVLIPHNLKSDREKKIFCVLIQSIRIAALLHDIGHPPFSHIIEDVLEEILKDLKNKKNKTELEKQYVNELTTYIKDEEDKFHENIGLYLVNNYIKKLKSDYKNKKYINLIFNCVKNIYLEKKEYFCLHKIIDSSTDGDRLDYITRDYINSGIDNGKINYSRIINGMKLVINNKNNYVFAFHIKALPLIEDVLQRRINLYKNILYHHRVIKTNFLLKNSVKKLILGFINETTSNKDISNLWKFIKDGKLISQWNDSWLINLLKCTYLSKQYNKESKDYLEEFITNKKIFYSLIKRIEDFKIIDDARFDVKIDEISENINDIMEDDEYNIFHDRHYFILNGLALSHFLSKIISIKSNFIYEIENHINKKFKYNCNFVFLKKALGLEKDSFIFDDSGNVYGLHHFSNINNILKTNWASFPDFYIYIRKCKNIDKNKLLKDIGGDIWNLVLNEMKNISKIK